ncbi:MAG: LURP-one-related family protein [Firmicutes bacterium]|nr:LURP-one-related family protein [Bacillota bacterium]
MYLYLKQKPLSSDEKFTFFDEQQKPVFKSMGSFFAIPRRYKLFDAVKNQEIVDITRRFFAFTPNFTITDTTTKQSLFFVKQCVFFGKPRFEISSSSGNYRIEGDLSKYEYDIIDPFGQRIISVRTKLISWGDTYEIWADNTKIPLHVAASIVLTVNCAAHSASRII